MKRKSNHPPGLASSYRASSVLPQNGSLAPGDSELAQSGNGVSRKDFLRLTGGFLTTAALSQYCATGSEHRFIHGTSDPTKEAKSSGLDHPILVALMAGISAPNPHNTQAWKFKISSETEALLYVDEKRILPQTDPSTRQIHMGQGCLLELVAVAAGSTGHEAKIQLFPEGYSVQDLGKKPVARIELVPSRKKDDLIEAVAHRHTVRSAYEGPPITQKEFESLRSITGARVSELRFTPAEELQKHLEFHFAGMQAELGNFPTADESRIWFRIGNEEIYSRRDGISLPANGVTGLQKWIIETFFLSHDPEDYYDPAGQKMFMDRYRENLFTAKGQVLFITKGNTVKEWVLCGRDYARFQLAASAMGLVMRPTSQLMQEFPAMQKLAEEYNAFVGVRPPARIQINALLGRADADFLSPRRPLEEMILENQ